MLVVADGCSAATADGVRFMNIHAAAPTAIAAYSANALLQRAPPSAPASNRYLSVIQDFAYLERDEELDLATRWREHGDRKAADALVRSHLRLAAKIATRYRGYGLPMTEIISEGNVGLMQALDRFDPTMGFRFSTYATWWIRSAIHEYILRSWSMVRIGTTARQKRLFFKLRSAKNKFAAHHNGDLRPDQVTAIANDLGVNDRDVIDMNRRLAGDTSLNLPVHDGQMGERQDYLVDQSPSPESLLTDQDEADYRHRALIAAIDVLNPRERRIFEARHLAEAPVKLEQLASEMNVSRERIRQIEIKAFEKVRAATRKRACEMQGSLRLSA
jgi:RNA polymerase sigma-32 factor